MASQQIQPIAGPSGIAGERYRRLISRLQPKKIETEEENQAALAIVESLMEKGAAGRSAEENALFNLLTTLIESFERNSYPLPDAEPVEVLHS